MHCVRLNKKHIVYTMCFLKTLELAYACFNTRSTVLPMSAGLRTT